VVAVQKFARNPEGNTEQSMEAAQELANKVIKSGKTYEQYIAELAKK